MAWSLNSRCYLRQQAAAERSMSWMVTHLYSDVASRPTSSRRSARLSVAKTTVHWRRLGPRGQEKRTRRAPLRGYVLVDHSSSQSVSQRAGLGCFTVSNTIYNVRLTREPSARLFAARPEAVSVGPDAWVLHAGQRRVSSRHQTTRTPAVDLGVCSNLCIHNKFCFFA